jgi:hypothetical protein
MNSPGIPIERSEGGSSIYKYESENEWVAATEEGCTEEISNHIELHLGPIKSVIHEIASDTVHVDVHIVPPQPQFPYYRLITSGMSDIPMVVPNQDCQRFAELLITVPAEWDFDHYNDNNERWNWPISLVRYLARFPHKYNTWLGWGHTIPNGNPATPFDSSTQFCGAIIIPSVSVPSDFHQLVINKTKTIQFFSVVPLYEIEMEYKLKKGTDQLLDLFDEYKINDIVNINRNPVVSKKWWQIW